MRLAIWPVPPARALASALADLVTEVVEIEPHEARPALDSGGADLALVPTLDVLRGYTGLEVVPGTIEIRFCWKKCRSHHSRSSNLARCKPIL